MSDATLAASLALMAGAAALLGHAALPDAPAPELAAQLEHLYDLTPAQARMIADGVPSELVLALDPGCSAWVDLQHEFPVQVACSEGLP